jgi:signal transduction histidine kinase
MRRLMWVLWPAGAALGVAGEWTLYGWGDLRHCVPDVVTGWCFIAGGLIGWSRRRDSRSGALLAATGFAWFAANFTTTGIAAIDWLSAHALYLHRGPVVAAVLTYPTGRAVGRVERIAFAAAAVAAAITLIGRNEYATIVLAVSLAALASRGYFRSVGAERRRRLYALQATFFLAAVFASTAVIHLTLPSDGAKEATLLSYEAALCALALGLLVGLLRAPWEGAKVTDLVVELGETRSTSLRAALARALGDPSLEIGYPLPEGGRYVDVAGRSLDLPSPSSDRRVTSLTREGAEIAVLVHDRAVFDDPELLDAVAAAARLSGSNARLQAEVHAQVAEVQASRRRLIDVGDEERRRLEVRLNDGAARRLASLERLLEPAHRNAGAETLQRIERAEVQTAHAIAELNELAAGLHPRELVEGGLRIALAALAGRCPVPVEVNVSSGRLPAEVEAAAFFVCSEALANVAKYASAKSAAVTVTANERGVRIEVVDDGVGDADPSRGTGLRGLADRVEALGGTLTLESPARRGTRLVAEVPLGVNAAAAISGR